MLRSQGARESIRRSLSESCMKAELISTSWNESSIEILRENNQPVPATTPAIDASGFTRHIGIDQNGITSAASLIDIHGHQQSVAPKNAQDLALRILRTTRRNVCQRFKITEKQMSDVVLHGLARCSQAKTLRSSSLSERRG